jgi:hypothetical protein
MPSLIVPRLAISAGDGCPLMLILKKGLPTNLRVLDYLNFTGVFGALVKGHIAEVPWPQW